MFYDNNVINDHKNDSKIYVSLGNYCLTSMIFKYHNIKVESFPFDWMVTKIDNVTNIINDNFKEFLNVYNYTKIQKGTRNNVYYNNTNTLFNFQFDSGDHQHHDFTNQNDYNYITRCVKRFNDLINTDKKIILVMIQPLYLSNLHIDDILYNNLYETLLNKFGDNIKLLIFNITNNDNKIYNERKINDKFFIYELKSKMCLGDFGMMWYDKEGITKFLELVCN
jgi:hypothetical protein